MTRLRARLVKSAAWLAAIALSLHFAGCAAPRKSGEAAVGIGHELTHGFDSQGRQYDASGNVGDRMWLDPQQRVAIW